MTIDFHILVSLVQLIVIALGGFYFIWTIKGRLDLLIQETGMKHNANLEKFSEIYKKLNDLAETTAQFVKQEMRMDNLDERIQELSNRINGSIRKTRAKK